jgi:nucleoside-diphosphate-sugar epimerase
MRVFITGVEGLVGCNLAEVPLARGNDLAGNIAVT